MRRLHPLFISIILTLIAFQAPIHAADAKNKGLYISPLRNYLSLKAGESVTRAYTVANLTNEPLVVTTSVEQFSVADYSYDLQFGRLEKNWISLVENRITLQPNESREIPYRVNIPTNAPAGGQYYTLFASTNLSEAGLSGTVRAATLLYLTVDGPLTRASNIEKASLFPLVLSPRIPYSIDVKNTGNIHYFAYFSAAVDGLFYHNEQPGASELLMPGTIRHFDLSTSSPFVPGVYRVTYGYQPDQGAAVRQEKYILFLPHWFLILLAMGTFIGIRLYRKRRTTDS